MRNKKRYLVTVILKSDGSIRIEVYAVSEEMTAEDVTYNPNTLWFFFVCSEKTKDEVIQEFVNIRLKNTTNVFFGKEMSNTRKHYIPEENRHLLRGAPVHFKNVTMSVEELIEEGFFEVI